VPTTRCTRPASSSDLLGRELFLPPRHRPGWRLSVVLGRESTPAAVAGRSQLGGAFSTDEFGLRPPSRPRPVCRAESCARSSPRQATATPVPGPLSFPAVCSARREVRAAARRREAGACAHHCALLTLVASRTLPGGDPDRRFDPSLRCLEARWSLVGLADHCPNWSIRCARTSVANPSAILVEAARTCG
jgi:hypothetical protein